RSSAFSRSGPAPIAATPGRFDVLPLGRLVTADTLGAGSDRIRAPRPKDDTRTSVRRWRDAPFRPGEEANALVTAAGGPPGRLPAGGGLRRYRAGRCGGWPGAVVGEAPLVVEQVGLQGVVEQRHAEQLQSHADRAVQVEAGVDRPGEGGPGPGRLGAQVRCPLQPDAG